MASAQAVPDLIDGQFLAVQILHDQFVIAFGGGFHQLDARFFGVGLQVGRDVDHFAFGAFARLHGDEIDHTFKAGLAADGQLQRHERAAQLTAQRITARAGNWRFRDPSC